MLETRTSTFRGHEFKFVCDPTNHASWWCYDDERGWRDGHFDVREGDVVVDVGAAFGSYVMPALAAGAKFVVAITPEDFLPWLNQSLDANDWRKKCLVLDEGVWEEEGFLHALENEHMPVFFKENPWKKGEKPRAGFPVSTIDKRILSLEQVDWIKIDVEGAEIEVLRGARDSIAKFRPKIMIEHHLFKDKQIEEKCKDLMKSMGYAETAREPYHAVSHGLYLPSS